VITTNISMAVFIDTTLANLFRLAERPVPVTLGATDLSDPAAITFTLAAGQEDMLNARDVVEFGNELVYITAKSEDTVPVHTCTRGYLGTNPSGHAAGGTGYLDPPFPRYRVQQSILAAFIRLNSLLPYISTETYNREPGKEYVTLPADTLAVYEVGYMNQFTGRYWEIPGWKFEDDLPTNIVPTGKLLRTTSVMTDPDSLIVKRRTPYTWSNVPPDEFSTVSVPIGAEDLPPIYAAALLASRREIGRLELDTSDEWTKLEVLRAGSVNQAILKDLWQQFYRGIDEVKRIYVPPRRRTYRKIGRF
jgi:hypothetical protein